MPSGHIDPSKPLTPLTEHAWALLARMDLGVPMAGINRNPGVWARLRREGLVEQVQQGFIRVYVITAAGRAKLRERP